MRVQGSWNMQEPTRGKQVCSAPRRAQHVLMTRSEPTMQDARYTSIAKNLSWSVGLKTFAHPAIATVSVLGQVLGPFVFAACMFSFVSQVRNMCTVS